MKLAVFLPNWIGDSVMCTPALRAVRNHLGPSAQITGVIRPVIADVLAGTTWLDDLIPYHPHGKDPAIGTKAVVRELRQRELDAILLMTNSLRSGAIAWLSGAKTRVGYVRYGRGPLLTHKLYPPRQGRRFLPTPAIDAYLQLAFALGCPWESPRMELAMLPADDAAADAFWKKSKLPSGRQVVVLNAGAAYGAAKTWPPEYVAQLARRIVTQDDLSVVVLCGPAEREVAREVVHLAAHPRVVSVADETPSVGLSKACIRRSRLLVSTDSGPRFFAAAFGVPFISVLGPTDRRWSSTHVEEELLLQHAVPCGPCGKRTCPLGHHDCMRLMTVDRVYAAVRQQLSADSAVRAA